MKKYFPPLDLLCKAMGTTPEALDKPGTVAVSTQLLRNLIKHALSNIEVDPTVYLEQNPDLKIALSRSPAGAIQNHYRSTGYFEGRPLPVAFDPDYYIRRYKDIRTAVVGRTLESPYRHYLDQGISELRVPRQDMESEIAEWVAVLFPKKRS